MKRDRFLSRLRRYCRKHNLTYEVDQARGKGSHITVFVGDRRTVVKGGELTPGYVALLLKQLRLPPDALE